MIVGVLIGKFLPAIPAFLNKLSVAGISIPIAILIWIMIYPMMMKVDFQSVKQVATNDLIILVAFVPTVKFLLGVSNVSVPYSTLFLSVFLFVVIPLVGGVLTRVGVIKSSGQEYFENIFVHKFDNATTIGLLLTLVITFCIPDRSNLIQSASYYFNCSAADYPDLLHICNCICILQDFKTAT